MFVNGQQLFQVSIILCTRLDNEGFLDKTIHLQRLVWAKDSHEAGLKMADKYNRHGGKEPQFIVDIDIEAALS